MSLGALLERNATASGTLASHDDSLVPTLRTVVLTCADHRVDPAHVLGLGLGDAVVLRNPGGRVTPDAIRSLLVLGTVAAVEDLRTDFQIVVMHHTDCGLSRLTGPEHASLIADFAGVEASAVGALHVDDPVLAVQHDVALLNSLGVLATPAVGLVYDIATGLVSRHAG